MTSRARSCAEQRDRVRRRRAQRGRVVGAHLRPSEPLAQLRPVLVQLRRRQRYRAGVRENVTGCRAIGTARSPSPTSTTGSSPNCSAIANPPSIVLIGPHGTPASTRSVEPLLGAAGGQALDEDRPQLVPVRRCGRCCGRTAGRRRPPECPAPRTACANSRSLAAAMIRSPVGGRQRLVGEDAGVRVAHAVGHDAAGDVGGAVVDQPGQRRGEQVDLHVLAHARSRRGGAARRGCRSPRGCRPSRRTPRSRRGRAGRPGRR